MMCWIRQVSRKIMGGIQIPLKEAISLNAWG